MSVTSLKSLKQLEAVFPFLTLHLLDVLPISLSCLSILLKFHLFFFFLVKIEESGVVVGCR